jgi:hypothetical protein
MAEQGDRTGQQFGNYRLERLLGRGGLVSPHPKRWWVPLVLTLLILMPFITGCVGSSTTSEKNGSPQATSTAQANATSTAQASPGKRWHPQTSGIEFNMRDIVWSGSLFVAVGHGGTILTSPDGLSWTSRTLNVHQRLDQHLRGIAWSGSQFVAIGGYSGIINPTGMFFTSPDGITWTSHTSGTKQYLFSVVWSGSQYVAGGLNGTILTSPDGISWTSHSVTITPDFGLNGIAWSGTQFVAVGDGGTILTSP